MEEKEKLHPNTKPFLTEGVRQWHRLPEEAVGAPSLNVFKAGLDGALGSLSWWVAVLKTNDAAGQD